jgi:uncharacterized coiled-coil protein SlyX
MKTDNGFEVVTTPSEDGKIVQETFSIATGIRERIMRQVLDTSEQQIRDALIRLGWTPHNEEGENAELEQKLATAEKQISIELIDAYQAQQETIESLNLRVARLVDALNELTEMVEEPPDRNCSCHISPPCSDCVEYSGLREALQQSRSALSSESDNQWLREKQAEALDAASVQLLGYHKGCSGKAQDVVMAENKLRQIASELRNQSPESDIDQATRII